jgi:hypothetical protein
MTPRTDSSPASCTDVDPSIVTCTAVIHQWEDPGIGISELDACEAMLQRQLAVRTNNGWRKWTSPDFAMCCEDPRPGTLQEHAQCQPGAMDASERCAPGTVCLMMDYYPYESKCHHLPGEPRTCADLPVALQVHHWDLALLYDGSCHSPLGSMQSLDLCSPGFATGTLDGMEVTSQQACCHCGGGSVPLLHAFHDIPLAGAHECPKVVVDNGLAVSSDIIECASDRTIFTSATGEARFWGTWVATFDEETLQWQGACDDDDGIRELTIFERPLGLYEECFTDEDCNFCSATCTSLHDYCMGLPSLLDATWTLGGPDCSSADAMSHDIKKCIPVPRGVQAAQDDCEVMHRYAISPNSFVEACATREQREHGDNTDSTASHLPQCEFVALMQATNDAIASGDVSSLSSHVAYQACAGVAETIGSVQISASCHQGGP